MSVLRMVLVAVPLAMAGAGMLAFAGCSQHEEHTDVVSNKVVAESNTARIPPLGRAPSATTSSDLIIVGYRDESGPTTMGWAYGHDTVTDDGGLGLGFVKCNASDPSCGAGPLPCNKLLGGVCMARGQAAWMGTPSLASDGRGKVVYVTLGDGDGDPTNGAELVVASLSTDGGRHFGVDQDATVVVNTAGCDSGVQDLPDATFDFTTEPATLWVVWRHKGASSFGGCVNHGIIRNGTIELGAPTPISNMDREHFGNLGAGQGGLRIQAGDGAVTVAFSNNDQLEDCPKLTHMQWGAVTSFDDGASWTRRSAIHHTARFPSCVLDRSVANTLRAFDFLRTPDGNYFVAVQDAADTVRVFYSAQLGVPVPPVLPTEDGQDEVWRELCSAPPPMHWTRVGGRCPQAAIHATLGKSVLYPTLAADGIDRVSLLLLESTAFERDLFPMYRGFTFPRSPHPTVNVAQLDFPSPPVHQDAGPVTPYLSMIARPPPNASPLTTGRQSCSLDEPFFPFWLERDGIITRRVQLSGL